MYSSGRAALRASYYGGLSLLFVLIVTGALPAVQVLGVDVTKQVSQNSEAYAFALLLPLWIEVARPRLATTVLQWPVTLLVAAGCLVVGALLYRAEGTLGGFGTLNETVLALAVLVPYVQVRRALPRWLGMLAAAAVIGVIVAGEQTTLVTRLAEGLGLLVLSALTFDVVDRALLDGSVMTPTSVRVVWYSLLLILPVTFSLLNGAVEDGTVAGFLTYAVRTQESFAGMWLSGMYLVLIGALRRPVSSDGRHPY